MSIKTSAASPPGGDDLDVEIAQVRRSPAGPSGAKWGPATINGNGQRGTGLLNNELYIGRLVWNRLRYVKDPTTGKRRSKPNRGTCTNRLTIRGEEGEAAILEGLKVRLMEPDLFEESPASLWPSSIASAWPIRPSWSARGSRS